MESTGREPVIGGWEKEARWPLWRSTFRCRWTGSSPDRTSTSIRVLGREGEILHAWLAEGDSQKVLHENLFGPAGAVITSRKVFDGTGGWGEDGLYRMPVFVATHRPHEVIVKGATTFTFVTEGIRHAVAQASAAAGSKKVHVMGGASVVQQVLKAGLADE